MGSESLTLSRRSVIATTAGALAAGLSRSAAAQASTPVASPAAGPWIYTDVLGNTVELPTTPVRIAANLVTAAALWDLGIRPVAVFDSTASAHPDGDHIAWGNIDASAVANIGDAEGNILPEDLINARPDVILTLSFDSSDPQSAVGVTPEMAGRINQVAPVVVVTDMKSTGIQLQRLVEMGELLGADLSAPEIVAARGTYEAKVDEFRTVAAEKATLTSLFMNFDAAEIYAGGPHGVAELEFLGSLGLKFANDGSDAAGEFWETLSAEQALLYPSDILYNDVYSAFQGIEALQGEPVYASMPAIAAGQVGEWKRDFPVSYAGLTGFLEDILIPLRTAEDVTP